MGGCIIGDLRFDISLGIYYPTSQISHLRSYLELVEIYLQVMRSEFGLLSLGA